MKITSIGVYEVALGMALGSYTSTKGTISALTTSIIAVDTDEGVTGWGEVCPYGADYLPAGLNAMEGGARYDQAFNRWCNN